MKNLKTLIKLRKHNINDLASRISMLEQHKDNLEKILINLVLEMRREIEKFSATEYGFVLDEYLVGARDTKKKYIHGILTLEDKINESKDMLYEEFGEMKKLEIALENRNKEAKLKIENIETKFLDDIGIMRSSNV